jgi:integrase
MSTYFVKKKGWRYDFTRNGHRHTEAWFATKAEAKEAEANRKEAIKNPQSVIETQTVMGFLELVNKRLDFLKAYKSEKYYSDNIYLAKRWVNEWGHLRCDEISPEMIQAYIIERSKVSAYTANVDLRCLRALFNFCIKIGWIAVNPTKGIEFLPVEKNIKYVPSKEDVAKVLLVADPDTRDYLYTIKETMARVGEVNRLTWDDVNFEERYVVLYTRKKKGGHLTPRKIPMTDRLFEILSRRYRNRDIDKQLVFWQRYWDRANKVWVEGAYQDRKRIMKTLCEKAGVKYFRFHALRHLGASMLENAKVNISSIQRILGHENRKTTEIYLHSIGDSEREAMRIYEKFSEKSHTDSHTTLQ